MASWCAASFGAMSASIFSISSSVFDWLRLKKAREVRVSSAPDFSIATMVFSKVGGAGSCAMASTSFRCSAMPFSKAGG